MITRVNEASAACCSKPQIENNFKEETKHIGQQDVLNHLDDGITRVDLTGKVTECNEASLRLLGLKREEIIGKNIYDVIIDEDKQLAIDGAAQVLKTGRIVTQVRVKRKNKPYFWAEISVTALYDQNRKPVEFLGVTRDISERKKAEESLKKSEELYRSLFENSDDGFILLKPLFDSKGNTFDFLFLKVNPAYERQTGRKATNVEGHRAKNVAPTLEQEWISIIDKVAKTGKSLHHEQFNQHTSKWYGAYFFAFPNKQVGVLFRDITERKKIEEALVTEKERYVSLANSLPEIIFEIDRNGRLVFANERAFEVTGYSKEDFENERDVFDLIAPQDRQRAIEDFNKTLKNQQTEYYEYNITRKDGSIFPANIIISTITDKGYPTGARGLVIDISEQKKMEKQLQNSQRLATIGQTAGMVGHDIRNPLQAITGDLYLIETTLETRPNCTNKDISESLESINDNIVYINKIVSDLQDYTRAMEPTLAEVQLRSLIVNALDSHRISEDIELQVDVDEDIWLNTDATYLKRIITNLTGNALQAMPSGGKLTISAYHDNNNVVITVEDTGVGIKDADKVNLFKPLFTTKAKGQGLGLAVVKRFVDALKGEIRFETQFLKGTKFTVILPKNASKPKKPLSSVC